MKSRYRVVKADTSIKDVSAAILAMDATLFPEDEPPGLHGDWWIAYAGKSPVAYAGLQPSSREFNTGYLCRAGVMPEGRGHGLQRRLIKVREKCAAVHRWASVITYTHPQNVHSINNLIAAGYRAYAPALVFPDGSWCYWRKTIDTGAL